MNKYIHSHLSYDEIIIDEDTNDLLIQRNTQVQPIKHKPFSIRRNRYNQTNSFHKNSSNDQTTQISKNQQENIQQVQNICQSQVNQYCSDFQSFQQELQQQVTNQVTNNQIISPPQKGKLTRSYNHSAILPHCKKQSIFKQTKHHRYSQISKMTQRINKSTIQLREQNKKMVISIQALRKILPQYRKNQIMLNEQRQQMKKMKYNRNKMFDVTYQFKLDKNLINKSECIDTTHRDIESTQRIIKHRDKNLVSKRVRRIGKAVQIKVNPQEETNTFLILKQQILYKRKQEERNLRIIVQLDEKIDQYKSIIKQLEQRQEIGVHQQLKRKKIVLQYDIQMQKTRKQERQCQLMISVSELNNKCSQVQIKIAKLNSQIASISLSVNQFKEQEVEKTGTNTKQTILANHSPKKISQRLMRLFQRKC